MNDEDLSVDTMRRPTYELYQLRRELPAYRRFAYMCYEWMRKHGYAIDPKNYKLVYEDELEFPWEDAEDIYRKFNLDKPLDYTGRSMSVSDVVVFTEDGKRKAFYCDSVGFKEIEWEEHEDG